MRELVLKETFAAPAAELFERIQDPALETKLLTLTKKSDVDIPPWSLKDNHSTRVISYLIQTSQSSWLSSLAKSADVQISKFQDVHINAELTEYLLDTKIFFGQTPVVSNLTLSLVVLDQNSTQCSITVKNSCKNMLLRDKVEALMEEEIKKETMLWLELLWESQMAYTAQKNAKPEIVEPTPNTMPLVTPTPTPVRSMTNKSYTWSSQDLQELGELEEIRLLSGGMAALTDELDGLRRTVESHYLRLCSLESHLTSQAASRGSRQTSGGSTPPTNPDGSISDSSSFVPQQQHLLDHPYNSLEELDARQRALRTQLSAQMQTIEKAFLKQQQASQQIKTLETRWDSMVDKMTKRLQEIDTLRYGVLGSWRQTLSVAGFIIIWPLVVRFLWIMFGKKWFTMLLRRYYWKTAGQPIAPALAPAVASSVQSTASTVSNIASTITNVASRAIRPSSMTRAASSTGAEHPVLSKLRPQSFWR